MVVIERKGRRIQLRTEPATEQGPDLPDYRALIRAPDGAADADRWGWGWPGEQGDLEPLERDPP